MNKIYISPSSEIIFFETEDVVICSGSMGGIDDKDTPWDD